MRKDKAKNIISNIVDMINLASLSLKHGPKFDNVLSS